MNNTYMYSLIGGHILFSVLWFVWRLRKSKSQAICECILILCMPVFGVLYIAGSQLIAKCIADNKHAYQHKKLKNQNRILQDLGKYDTDIIPLNDALYIEGMNKKRSLLTDAIQHDVLVNQQILFKAIGDEDREVSHYAASTLTNKIEQLEGALFKLYKKIKEKPDELSLLQAYAETMEDYLSIGYLDQLSKKQSEQRYAAILERILMQMDTKEEFFAAKIRCELRLKNIVKAETFCDKFLRVFPRSEAPYIYYIKVYQQAKKYDKLQEKIAQLKTCPIKLSPEALRIIRFWDGGRVNVQ